MNEPLFPCKNALQTPNPPFWTTKTAVPKFPQNGGSTPTPRLDKAVHAQGGGRVPSIKPRKCYWKDDDTSRHPEVPSYDSLSVPPTIGNVFTVTSRWRGWGGMRGHLNHVMPSVHGVHVQGDDLRPEVVQALEGLRRGVDFELPNVGFGEQHLRGHRWERNAGRACKTG